MSQDASPLLQPARFGDLELANRVVMAPLTRSRASRDHVIQPISTEYYRQRATAGLIVTEATNISPQGVGYAFTPSIHSNTQVAAWRPVTDAVHAAGGRIVLQLWHVGRISHPDLQPGGALPVAPSAIRPRGEAFTEDGFKPHVTPRALETDELSGIVEQYRHAAQNAKRAGFDGVEVHAANGYLLHQFLSDGTNRRTDAYGGSIENRARLLMEVVEAVAGVWGASRVGVRLSPNTDFGDIADSDPRALYSYVVKALNRFGLAYLHVVEGFPGAAGSVPAAFDLDVLRPLFAGAYVVNGGYTRQRGIDVMSAGLADAVAYGRPFIANPDLVRRFDLDAPLNEPDPSTFYGGDAHGYTDYPFLPEAPRAVA